MTTRRGLLYVLGLGAAAAVVAPGQVFAKQFARETTPVELPDMVYDPELQVMVDPETRQQLYSRGEMLAAQGRDSTDKQTSKPKHKAKHKSKPLPTVTAGCKTCPKCDDHCG